MRISAIAPVGRPTARPVDPISWYEASSNVRAVEANEAARRGAFQKALERVEEESHKACTRVLEVVFAPGLSPGYVRHRQGRR